MKVAVVFLTFNRLEFSQRAVLNNLEKASYPIEEVCFLDNGSTDGTKEWLETLKGKKVFNSENRGIAEGYNQLYGMVGEVDLIARPSSDMCMPQDWLKAMVGWHEKIPRTGIVAMVSRSYLDCYHSRFLGDKVLVNGYEIQPANALGSIVFKRELAKLKLPEFGKYGYDDTIWTEKVRKAGYLNYYCEGVAEDYPQEEREKYPEYFNWKMEQLKQLEKERPELLSLNKQING